MADHHGLSRDGPPEGDAEVFRERYDWAVTAPSIAVVEAASAALGRDPIELAPLGGTVDPDALNALLSGSGARESGRGLAVTFQYAGLLVRARAGGTVVVCPVE